MTSQDDVPVTAMTALDGAGYPNAGASICPLCGRTWLVTAMADCLMPACGCYGHDTTAGNPSRPCEPCGISHSMTCQEMP